MKKYLLGLFVLVFGLVFAGQASAATIFTDSFGSNDLGTDYDEISWNSWSNGGNGGYPGDDAEIRVSGSGNDSASPDGDRFAVMLGEDGYICRTIDTTGYENVKLSYYWRGDEDSHGSSDDGYVEYKATGSSCSSGSFTTLKNHDLRDDDSWTTQTAFDLPDVLDDTTFKLRFRVSTNDDDEHFRVDGILITGDPIVENGSITVYKNVINPDGGEVSDNQSFTIWLDGSESAAISESSSHLYTDLVPGEYTITEDADGDYDFVSFSVDNDNETAGAQVTVTAGTNTVLTVTNKQKKGTITVNKVVTNPNGGEAVAGDFWFKVNLGEAIQFIQDEFDELMGSNTLEVNPGSFSVTEVLPEGSYAISYDGCSFDLSSNGSQTCTITNSDIPEGMGSITVVKSVVNDNGGVLTEDDFSLYIDESSVNSGDANFLEPGEYIITEGGLPSGYTQTSIFCTNGETETSGSVNLSEQESWVCTITNDDQPATLTIVKNAINEAWNAAVGNTFSFNLSSQEELIDLTTVEGSASTSIVLDAGSYDLSEIVLDGWTLSGLSCDTEVDEIENGVSLNLVNGQEITCTFTNTRQTGTLIVRKTVINDNEGESNVNDFPGFQINDGEPVLFNSLDESGMSAENTLVLETGTYVITEPEIEGYDRTLEVDCGNVVLSEGATEYCDIINNDLTSGSGNNPAGSSGGEVLGEQTENTDTEDGNAETENTEEEQGEEVPADSVKEPNVEGEVLGETTCTPYLTSYLRQGRKNDKGQVVLLQQFLNENLGLTLVADGTFGNATKSAVISFQEKYAADVLLPWAPFGLDTSHGTGYVYKTTKWKINDLKCPGSEAFPTLP